MVVTKESKRGYQIGRRPKRREETRDYEDRSNNKNRNSYHYYKETKLQKKRNRRRKTSTNKPPRPKDDFIQGPHNKVDYVLQIAGEKQRISIQ